MTVMHSKICRDLPALASLKAVVSGDYVYLVGGTSFAYDPAPKFLTTLFLGTSGDWRSADIGEIIDCDPSTKFLNQFDFCSVVVSF